MTIHQHVIYRSPGETRLIVGDTFLQCDEADNPKPILLTEVDAVHVSKRLFSPLALLMPVVACVFGVIVLSVLFMSFRIPSVITVISCIGVTSLMFYYAITELKSYVLLRRHTFYVVCDKDNERLDIRFYVTDNREEAMEIAQAIESAMQQVGRTSFTVGWH